MIRHGTDERWAELSECGRYRYALGVMWGPAVEVLCGCLLNPSDADHIVPDPTSDRMIDFAKRWGYGGVVIVNPYAFRCSDPRDLPTLDRRPSTRAIGPENDERIELHATRRDVVVGWGKGCTIERARAVTAILRRAATKIDCLGTNRDGSPKHPLYLKATTERRPWSPALPSVPT
jgi:hypothetical protein